MAVKIATPNYEAHIAGCDSFYTPDIQWQFSAFIDDVIRVAQNCNIVWHNQDLSLALNIDDATIEVGYMKGVVNAANRLGIRLYVYDPESLSLVFQHRYGSLIRKDDAAKQQLLDLLNGDYREEMKSE